LNRWLAKPANAARVADDFRLELRAVPPGQVEEDALRDFIHWIRTNVQIVDDTSSPTGHDALWLEALRPAARHWFDAMAAVPPLSPPASVETLGDYLLDLSPPDLIVARAELCNFLRVAFRFWVTELRPLWMARQCHRPSHADQDCVLLARVDVPVVWVGGSPTGTWVVSGGAADVTVD
jgi:hypothetical protein